MDDLQWFMDAFNILNASRPLGGMGGAGPIPVSEINAFLQLTDVQDVLFREEILTYIKRLDQVWLKQHAKEMEKESKAGGKKK